jgi:AMIN domain
LPRPYIQFAAGILFAALVATRARPQDQAKAVAPSESHETSQLTVVTSVRMSREQNAAAVEVVSTRPLAPQIQTLDSPPRLVIDLPNARLEVKQKRIPVLQDDILTLRTEQFRRKPAIVRVVLDLLVPYAYTWDSAGNRLMVRLKPLAPANAANKPAQTPQALSLQPVTAAAVVPVTSGVGEVILADRHFAAGSSLTAGSDTAILRLNRGGEVLVCPRTSVSITPSSSSKDLMIGMGTGALETHYTLDTSADTVLTPDFRILFAGPGEFDYAISTDAHGDTCVRGLAGNTSSAIVSELMGDRIYQVKPSEHVVFRSGRIDKFDGNVPLECGCPPPVPVMRTDSAPPQIMPDPDSSPAKTTLDGNGASSPPAKPPDADHVPSGPQALSNGPETQSLPPLQPNDVQVQVDAPFVFRGGKSAMASAEPVYVADLPVMEWPARAPWLDAQVQPPPSSRAEASTPSPSRRFLRRIKGFLSAIFS